ncbi:MAG: flagellar biosynthesis protein [Candidatus Riflebacteria bacterium]|nr:flagellar biosynthesis protein [Candidatus Riflebacteria bacterium]
MITRQLINQISGQGIVSRGENKTNKSAVNALNGQIFGNILQKSLVSNRSGLNISAHADKRIAERNMDFSSDVQKVLNDAVNELQAKGAKESLILTKGGAFLVNVPSRTLITAITPDEMHDKIITQIDSVSIKTQ